MQIKLIFTLAGLAYYLHTIKNFREISNKLSKNSFNPPVIRPNKCLAKQDYEFTIRGFAIKPTWNKPSVLNK